jgi:hypothetical protein
MTESEYQHRLEQMEAARQEFQDIWREELFKASETYAILVRNKVAPLAEHMAWLVFKKAKGIQ